MHYRSKINYYTFAFRIIFILVCFFFLLALLNIIPLLYTDGRTPFIGKLLMGISGGAGMCWGIYTTIRAIYLRTVIISIEDKNILIHQSFKKKKDYYRSADIKKITTGKVYNNGNWSRGIKIEFRNGDKYEFIWYDYLNFQDLIKSLQSLRKVDEKFLI